MKRRRRAEALDAGEHLSVPDYAMFRQACDEAGKELGLPGSTVSSIYRRFLNHSLTLMFPDGDPRQMTDEKLLSRRRILRVPFIASMEVTAKALRHWRNAEAAVNRKKSLDNYT